MTNPRVLAERLYNGILNDIEPLKYSVDPVNQLTERLSRMILKSDRRFRIAGFVCPFYKMDEQKLDEGFGEAVKGIGLGCLEEHPRYQSKMDRLLKITDKVAMIFRGEAEVELTILLGDKGIINANKMDDKGRLMEIINQNLDAYRKYHASHSNKLVRVNIDLFSAYTGCYYEVGQPLSDLTEDGEKLMNGSVSFFMNERVKRGLVSSLRIKERYGFALNYGLAGMILRDREMVIGTDKPGSQLNYMYHTFIRNEDLFVVVPK
jgi:hypothetical protein